MDNINNFNSKPTSTMSVIIILGVTLVMIYILYRIYNFYTDEKVTQKVLKELVQKARNGKQYFKISSNEIPISPYSNEYSISFWLLINDYDYKLKQPKIIMIKGGKNGENANPEIRLEPLTNDLRVKIKLQSQSMENFDNNNTNHNGNNDTNHNIKIVSSDDVSGIEEVVKYRNLVNDDEPLSSRHILNESFGNVSGNEFDNSTINYNKEYFMEISGNDVEHFQDTSDEAGSTTNTQTENNATAQMVADINSMDFTVNEYKQKLLNFLESLCNHVQTINSQDTAKDVVDNLNSRFALIKSMSNTIKTVTAFTESNLNRMLSQISLENLSRAMMFDDDNFIKNYIYLNIFDSKATDAVKNTLNSEKEEIINNIKIRLQDINCDIPIDYNNRSTLNDQIVNILQTAVEKLIVRVARNLDSNLIYANPNTDSFDSCILKDIPLQRWNHVVVSVYNNNVDLYLNGKLSRSCVLKGFPKPNTDHLHFNVNDGFDGQIAKSVFVNSSLNPTEVYDLYKMGPVYSEGFFTSLSNYFSTSN